jgi:hypothetical protein
MDKTGAFHYRFVDLAIPGQNLKTVQKLPSFASSLLALMPFIQFLEPLQMRFHSIFFTATFLLI